MKSKKEKVLPVAYPSITSWPWHAILFSILETREETKPWIYSNYINLVGGMDDVVTSFDFSPNVIDYAICPWINAQLFSREYLSKNHKNIKQFFIDAIDSGAYIFTIINTQYAFRNIIGENIGKYIHETMIYGYDVEKGKFNIADFTYRGKYSFEEVDMDCVVKGYLDVNVEEDYIAHRREGVFLLKFNERAKYKFDLVLVKYNLKNYINGKGLDCTTRTVITDNSFMNTGLEEKTGISSYDLLFHYLTLVGAGSRAIDKRIPHVIFDHKELMLKRLLFMIDEGFIENDENIIYKMTKIRDLAMQNRNLLLKSMVASVPIKSDDIINKYMTLRDMEMDLYDLVLQQL